MLLWQRAKPIVELNDVEGRADERVDGLRAQVKTGFDHIDPTWVIFVLITAKLSKRPCMIESDSLVSNISHTAKRQQTERRGRE